MRLYLPAIRIFVVTSLTIILMRSEVMQAKEENEETKIPEEPTETANTNATPTTTTHFSDELMVARPVEELISHKAQTIPTSSLIKQQHSSVQTTPSRGVAEKSLTPDSEEENIGRLTSVAFSTDTIKSSATAMAVNTVVQETVKQTNKGLESSSTMVKIATALTMARNPSFTVSPETNTTVQVIVKQTDLVSTPVMTKVAAFATTAVNTSSAVASATTDLAIQIAPKQTDQVSIAGTAKAAESSTIAINTSSAVESVKQTKPLIKTVTTTPRKHLVLTIAAATSAAAVNSLSSAVSSATIDIAVQITPKQTNQVSTAGMTKATTSSTMAINTNSTVESFKQTKPLATPMLVKTVKPTSLPMTPKVTKHLTTSELYSATTSLGPRRFTASITMKIPPEVEYSSQASKGEELWWLYVCVPLILLAGLLVTGAVYAIRKRSARKSKELPEERHRLNEETPL